MLVARPPFISWKSVSSFPIQSVGIYRGLGSGMGLQPADVWFANLNEVFAEMGNLQTFISVLSRSENDRAQRFKQEIHRHRFILARGLLRLLLSHYTGQNPAHIELIYNDRGKPSLKASQTISNLAFNLSHSQEYVLYAFGRHPLGVDLEQITQQRDVLGIAKRFFSPTELTILEQLSPPDRAITFLRYWVCKEAYVKATGEGLADRLRHIEIHLYPYPKINDRQGNLFAPIQLIELSPSCQTIAAIVLTGQEN
jgi:4'-phosphopantetheinyl transferase